MKKFPNDFRQPTGTAYIGIPKDIDRDTFVERCYRTGLVCLIDDNSQFHKEIKITIQSLKDIYFPSVYTELGSLIVWNKDPKSGQPIVTGVLLKNDESLSLSEGQWQVVKSTQTSQTSIVTTKDGQVLISAKSSGENNKVVIDISSVSKNSDAQINLFVKGTCNIQSVGTTNIKATEEVLVEVKKPNDASSLVFINKDEIHLESKKVYHNSGKYSMVLGEELSSLLSEFFTEVSNITTATMIGVQPVINKLLIVKFKAKLDKIVSKLSFLE